MNIQIRAIDVLPFNWHFVYAHGKLAETLYDDRISSDHNMASVPDGVINPEYKGQPLVAFLWTTSTRRKGLVVFPHDKEAMQYAMECCENKEQWL